MDLRVSSFEAKYFRTLFMIFSRFFIQVDEQLLDQIIKLFSWNSFEVYLFLKQWVILPYQLKNIFHMIFERNPWVQTTRACQVKAEWFSICACQIKCEVTTLKLLAQKIILIPSFNISLPLEHTSTNTLQINVSKNIFIIIKTDKYYNANR